MRISENLQKALNDQIKAELDSAYLYLGMANWLQGKNFSGMAHWFRVQAKEEQEHAMKIHDYLISRGVTPVLLSVEAPKTNWNSVADVFKKAYEHECDVTKMIYDLVDMATADKDYAGISMLQWFVNEQVEEEAQSCELAETSAAIGESLSGLMVFDQRLGARKED